MYYYIYKLADLLPSNYKIIESMIKSSIDNWSDGEYNKIDMSGIHSIFDTQQPGDIVYYNLMREKLKGKKTTQEINNLFSILLKNYFNNEFIVIGIFSKFINNYLTIKEEYKNSTKEKQKDTNYCNTYNIIHDISLKVKYVIDNFNSDNIFKLNIIDKKLSNYNLFSTRTPLSFDSNINYIGNGLLGWCWINLGSEIPFDNIAKYNNSSKSFNQTNYKIFMEYFKKNADKNSKINIVTIPEFNTINKDTVKLKAFNQQLKTYAAETNLSFYIYYNNNYYICYYDIDYRLYLKLNNK